MRDKTVGLVLLIAEGIAGEAIARCLHAWSSKGTTTTKSGDSSGPIKHFLSNLRMAFELNGQTNPPIPPYSFLSEHHLSPSGAFPSPLVAVLVGLDKGCQFPPLSGWLDVNGHCLVGRWWGL